MKSIKYKITLGFCLAVTVVIVIIVATVSFKLDSNITYQSDMLAGHMTESSNKVLTGYIDILESFINNVKNNAYRSNSDISTNPQTAIFIERQQASPLYDILKSACETSELDFAIVYDAKGYEMSSYPLDTSIASVEKYYKNSLIGQKAQQAIKGQAEETIEEMTVLVREDSQFLSALTLQKLDVGGKGAVIIMTAGLVKDDFGDPIGVCIAGAVLNKYAKPFEQFHKATGAPCALYIDDVPVVQAGFTEQPLDKAGLEGFSIGSKLVNQAYESKTAVNAPATILGAEYLTAVHSMPNPANENVGILLIGTPKSEILKTQQSLISYGLQAKNNVLVWLVGIGIAAFVVFIVISLGLSSLITRPILKCAKFAQTLANGDLSAKLEVKSKDEIGTLTQSLNKMPETLNNITSEVGRLVEEIEVGKLRARGDNKNLKGDFASLITGINRLADVYTGHINSLPMPIIISDRRQDILFVNDYACKQAGMDSSQADGRKCYEIFSNAKCRTDECPAMRAMNQGEAVEDEITIRAENKTLEYNSLNVPISKNGNAVAALEMLIDETAIKTAQRKLHNLADEAANVSVRVSSSSEELAAQVEEASRGAERQKDRAAETSTAMEEMNATVTEMAQNASQAADSATHARSKAEEGSRIVNEVISDINDIQKSAEELENSMNELGDQAESISQVINVITDIADQTNLLALNAAIEAARAGDAGRGFAVVADEVRKLAEKTMTATKQVNEAISNIQDMTRKNVAATQTAVEAVAQSVEKAELSGQALGEIVSIVQSTADQVQNIATAVEQQTAASEEISKATDEISIISGETSEIMNQSAQAIQELADQAGNLKTLIEEMQEE